MQHLPDALLPGPPYPLGATWDGLGINFAVFSAHAAADRAVPVRSVRPPRDRALHAAGIHRRGLARLSARCDAPACSTAIAPTAPTSRSTAIASITHKLLLDPYARAHGRRRCTGRMRCTAIACTRRAPTCRSTAATARPAMPKGVVTDDIFNWGDDRPPAVPWSDTVIYEAHVRGLTMLRDGHPRRTSAAPSPPSAIPRSSITCAGSASPRSS